MEATAKVTLDASGYDAGAQKVKNSTKEMETATRTGFDEMGRASTRAFDAVDTGAQRAVRSYRQMVAEVQQGGRVLDQEARRAEAAMKVRHSHGSSGNSYQRNQELSHVGRSVIDTVMAGQSPLRALEMEGPRLVQAFGGGLGTLLGVGTAVALMGKLVSKTVEATAEAKELGREFHTALRAGPTSGQEDAGGIKARLSELDEIIHKNGPATNFTDKAGQKVKDMLADFWRSTKETKLSEFWDLDAASERQHNTDSGKDRRNLVRQAENQRAQKLRELTAVQRESNDLDERAARSGESSVRADQIRLETRRKIAALENDMGLPKLKSDYDQARNPQERASIGRELHDKEVSFVAQSTQIERMANLQIAADARRQAATKVTLDLEGELLRIKRDGADVDVRSAQARYNAALKTLRAGPDSGNEYLVNKVKLNDTAEEIRTAQRVTAERREELGIRTAVAVLTDKADAAHLLALSLEEQKLKGRLASSAYGADAKAGFAVDLLENQASQRAGIEAGMQRANQGWLAVRAATYQRGFAGQKQSIEDRQFLLGMEMDKNTAGTRDDGSTVWKNANLGNEQLLQAAQLKREMEDLQNMRERELGAAKEVVKETDLQARGMRQAAADAATIFSLTQQIKTANQNNNAELANTKQAQLDIIQNEIKLRNFLHPEGPAAERAEGRAHDQAQRAYNRSGGLLNPTIGWDGEVIDGIDPATGQRRETTRDERRASREARRGYEAGTPRMFNDSTARDALDKPTGAADALTRLRGDPDHDPAARLARAKIFRDFDDPKNRPNAAEQNRPNQPPKPAPEKEPALVGQVAALVAQLAGIASKIGVAR